MKRALVVIALLAGLAVAFLTLRARTSRLAVPVAASAALVSPPAPEPPERLLARTKRSSAELRRGDVEVTGVVKDLGGGVVAGATVTVKMARDGSGVGQVVTSDANGELRAWIDAGEIEATATADGYSAGTWSGVAPGQRLELVLTPESVLEGRVVEAGTGVPVAGALVVADAQEGDASSKGMSDAEGRFRLRGLAPGHYKPEAVTPNRAGTSRASVLLGLAETVSDVVVEVHPSLLVSGRILRGDAGCRGATITLVAKTPNTLGDVRRADADDDGNVQIEGVFSGTYDVALHCDGSIDGTFSPVVVKDADVRALVWKTETGLSVKGTLFDDRGRAVAGATVAARREDTLARANTGPDGSFVISTLLEGTYDLIASRSGLYGDAALATVTATHDIDGVRLTLPSAGTLRGRVVDDRGAPVKGVSVELDALAMIGSADHAVRDDGTFEVEGLLPGDYRLGVLRGRRVLRFPSLPEQGEQHVPVTISAGAAAVVTLRVEGEHGVIRGRVLDAAKNPLGDVFVEAERMERGEGTDAPHFERASFGGAAPVLVDPGGRFTIGKLAAGSYGVRAYRKGGGDAILAGVALGSDITLVLQDDGSVSGTVAGVALERFDVGATETGTSGFSRLESFFRTDGAFAIRDLPPGAYELVAESAAGRGSLKVTLGPGHARSNLRIPLVPYARLRARVVAAGDGKPIPGLVAFVSSDDLATMSSPENAKTDADGRFELVRVKSGPMTVTVVEDGSHAVWAGYERKLTVPGGETVDLPDIRMERRGVRHGPLD